MNLLSADHLCKLLKLGIEEVKEPSRNGTVPTSVITAPYVGKKRDYNNHTNYPDFTFLCARDFSDDYIEVTCEVIDIEPPDPGTGCGYSVQIGATWDKDDNPFPLTDLEHTTAERQAAAALSK